MDSRARLVVAISLILLITATGSVGAEDPNPVAGTERYPAALQSELAPKWGITATTYLSVPSFAFHGYNASHDARIQGIGPERYCSDDCLLYAPVNPLNGSSMFFFQVNLYDANATEEVLCQFLECPGDATCNIVSSFGTGIAWADGRAWFAIPITPAYTVDTEGNTYAVRCTIDGGTSATRVRFVKLNYRLQVSPAPVSATFGDVSTGHLFFQHIEALAASGITVGCGGGNYCPDAPVTRGQMAVFLAKALGLHWPY